VNKIVRILGVPMDLGQARRGVDMGPSALRYSGLGARVRALGYGVEDHGNVVTPVRDTLPAGGGRDFLSAVVATGEAVYWSRSRAALWRKGETSGHLQRIVEIRLDCDSDTLLLRVEQVGGIACHTGRESCFYRVYDQGEWRETDPVLRDPADIYGAGH